MGSGSVRRRMVRMMADKKDSFIFHLENEEDLQDLTLEEKGRVFLAMIEYQKTGEEPDFEDRALRTAWRPLLRRLKADEAAYQERCKTNRANGSLGGRPAKRENKKAKNRTVFSKNQMVSNENPKNQTDNLGFYEKPKKPDTDTDSDTDTDTDTDIMIDRKVINNISNNDDDVYIHSIKNIQGDESDDDGGAARADIYLQLKDSSLFCVSGSRINELQKLYPEVNIRQQLAIMADKMRNSPEKRISREHMEGYIRTWLQKEAGRARDREANARAKASAIGKRSSKDRIQQHDYDFGAIDAALDKM